MTPQAFRSYFRSIYEPIKRGGKCRSNKAHIYQLRRVSDGKCAQCIYEEDVAGRAHAKRRGEIYGRDMLARRRIRAANAAKRGTHVSASQLLHSKPVGLSTEMIWLIAP